MTVKAPTISSHTEKVADSLDKSQRPGGEAQPQKDLESIAGSSSQQSDNLTKTSSVVTEAEAAKKSVVNKSGSFKEEQKPPIEKAQSVATADNVIIILTVFSTGMFTIYLTIQHCLFFTD